MPNIYKMILDEAKRRNIIYYEKYFPFYVSSLGCHIFNQLNEEREIYTEGGVVPNTRLHILMVAFPGFGKSYFLKQQLYSKSYSLYQDSGIRCGFKSGKMTEAGFIGSVDTDENGKPVMQFGLCHQTREGKSILGIEEFSAVTNSFKQDYNVGLDTAMLTALDSGDVGKDLKGGSLTYHTQLTLWAGVQPARYDLSSGFSRRFIFMAFYPTLKDIQYFRNKRREAKGIRTNITALKNIRLSLRQRTAEIKQNLKNVVISQDFYAFINKFDQMHYDDELCERVGIGYWLMRSEHIQDQLIVRMEPELKRILLLLKDYEHTVRNTSPTTIVWKLISEENKIQKGTILNYASRLGLHNSEIQGALSTLSRKKYIHVDGFNVEIIKKVS